MTYLRLFWEFFKTGLFAVGGGMATVPFLKNIGLATGWYSQTDLMNMLAVSESTPGPIGINMATYVGFTVAGIPGAVIATIGEVTPSIIVILIVAAMLTKFRNSNYVENAFYGLRPASSGLIGAACAGVVLQVLLRVTSTAVPDSLFMRFSWDGTVSWMGLALAAVLYPASRKVAGHVDYQPLFIIVSLIMAVSVLVLALTVKEKRLSEENRALEKQHPDWNLAAKDESGNEVLPKEVKRSLTFLLASISLWFIAYNGVTTWFTKYIEQVMGEGLGGASTCLLVATAGAICSYIPIGALAAKIGRKRTIQLGVALLTLCFLLGFVLTCTSSVITPVMYVVFALVGLAWAAINVNSLPMVVEMCRGSDIGRFTGYYYTFSMVAQVVTPIAAGSLMRAIDYRVLFPYAAIFSALSFVTMCFVRHGDAKAEAKKGLEAFEDMDVE